MAREVPGGSLAGRRRAAWLRAGGHDVKEVREHSPLMVDSEILAAAHAEDRIVITVDKDFGALAMAQRKPHKGIVRLPDVPAAMRKRLPERVLINHERELERGAVITVSPRRIRIRLS